MCRRMQAGQCSLGCQPLLLDAVLLLATMTAHAQPARQPLRMQNRCVRPALAQRPPLLVMPLTAPRKQAARLPRPQLH